MGNLKSDGIGEVQLFRDIKEGGGCVRSNPIGCWILVHGIDAEFEGGHRCSGTGKRASGGANGEATPLEAEEAKAACNSAEL